MKPPTVEARADVSIPGMFPYGAADHEWMYGMDIRMSITFKLGDHTRALNELDAAYREVREQILTTRKEEEHHD